jgi:hypothetical protein
MVNTKSTILKKQERQHVALLYFFILFFKKIYFVYLYFY